MKRLIVSILLLVAFALAILFGLIPVPNAEGAEPEGGPAVPEFFTFVIDSEQPKVCNNCSFTGPAVVVHMTPITTLPLYIRFTSTYISPAKGLKLQDVYTEGGCVQILNVGVGVDGYTVNAKITCRPQNGNVIIAVRYQPLEIAEIPIGVDYADSGNWDLIRRDTLTVKVKQDPWVIEVLPQGITPGEVFALEGGFDEKADVTKVAFRAPDNIMPAELGEIVSVTHTRMVVRAPREFRLPWQWQWRIFVIEKESEESDIDSRMSEWVPITLLGEKMYLPLIR